MVFPSCRGGRSVGARRGMASPELTLRTYAHLMPSDGGEMGFLEAEPSGLREAK